MPAEAYAHVPVPHWSLRRSVEVIHVTPQAVLCASYLVGGRPGDATPYLEKLVQALGFTRTFHSTEWRVFAAGGELPQAAYFAITEDPDHRPNKNLIGSWAQSPQDVDRIAAVVLESGGKITSGPQHFPISSSYYAVFFEDPCGNAYEVTCRID